MTEKGFGKRTAMTEYRTIGRGGVGVTNLKITEKNGNAVAILAVEPTEGVMFISKEGIILRTKISQISEVGRATQGVRVMRLSGDDRLVSVTLIDAEEATDAPVETTSLDEPDQ